MNKYSDNKFSSKRDRKIIIFFTALVGVGAFGIYGIQSKLLSQFPHFSVTVISRTKRGREREREGGREGERERESE